MNTLKKIKKLVKKFKSVQARYAGCGAADSEPKNQFRYIVRMAIDEDTNEAQISPEFWGLLGARTWANSAAKELGAVAYDVAELLINDASYEEREVARIEYV